jgi:hypothetical protein
MRLLGNPTKANADPEDLVADTIYAAEFTLPVDARVPKLSAYVDELGSGSGNQLVRGGIWTSSGVLLEGGEDVSLVLPDGLESFTPIWQDLPFSEPVDLTAGTYRIGIHAGTPDSAWRIWTDPDMTRLRKSDTFSDGTANLSGATSEPGVAALYATYTTPYFPPDTEDDFYFARLGFPDAQAALSVEAPDPRSRRLTHATWHGTYLDAETQGSSFAIVQTGSELEGLVGDRIRLKFGQRSVVAFVHRDTDLDLDDDEIEISISRRLFAELAPLSTERLFVLVETLGVAVP